MGNYNSFYLKGIFLLICLSSGVFTSAIVTPALLDMKGYYLVSVNQVNSVITVYLAGYLCGQIFSASLGKTFNAIQIIRLGILTFILGNVVCIYSIQITDFYYILLGRFIAAIGISSGLVCSIYLINSTFNREHSLIWLSWGVSSYAIAIIISVAIGGYIAEIYSWENIFYLLILYGVSLFIGSFFVYLPNTLPKKNLSQR